jgi:hypothetical protein
VVGAGQDPLHLPERKGCADTRDHVLTLGVQQKLTEDALLPRGGVAGERHPGRRGLSHVPEDHPLHGNGRPRRLRYAVLPAVRRRPLSHPRVEDRPYRQL